MSQRRALALLPRTRKGLVFFWTALFMLSMALQYAAAASPKSALATDEVNACDSFSIQTSDVNGGPVNQNHYTSKPEVYLQGGPDSGEDSLPAGTVVYYQVQEPDGTPLMVIRSTTIGADGTFRVQLAPFDTTSNEGNVYKVVVSTDAQLDDPGCTKSDNFKVDGPGTLTVKKAIEGGPGNFSGDFPFNLDCGIAGEWDSVIQYPNSGIAGFEVDALAECTVTEGTLPAPPEGYAWGAPTYTNNPATVVSGENVTIHIVNHLNLIPNPSFTIAKSVSLSADGPWSDEVTTTTGTTVYYRITVTNTGNVELTALTLTDNEFDLVAEGCEIPTSLAVGAHFDCNYSNVAETGTLVNTATADTAETPEDTDDATVIATPPNAPGLSVVKSVSLSADGPWVDSLAVQTGTTVYYRITITNTGNVGLTAVTLTDNEFNLVTEGCVIPTTLAVGVHYDCNYSNVAETGTLVNTATGDSEETASDTDTATVIATVEAPAPTLTIDKTNNAPLVLLPGTTTAIPTATVGSTVTYTLTYSVTGSVSGLVITDVLPLGLNYVAGSATSNGDVSFDGYTPGTRTLTWSADEDVDASGAVSYQAVVAVAANQRPQPLVNVAAIDSDDTDEDTDDSSVFVPAPVRGETSVPTAPRTDTLTSGGTSAPGISLGLIVLALVGLILAIAFVTPVPTSVRERINRR